MQDILFNVSIWLIPVFSAITFHEAAHGWAAWRLGDDTAKKLGRVSFNPLKHIDPFGTVLLPALLLLGSGGHMMFGYAKPVPVNFARLRQPRRHMVLVAAAGPVVNLLLAITWAGLAHILPALSSDASAWLAYNIYNGIWINCLLLIFNMMPLPPLDGGRVAVGLLPVPLAMRLARLERFGFLIILGALFALPLLGEQIGIDLNVFWWLVGAPAEYLMKLIFTLMGIA
ncbi:MAG: site-2 protease family protein [Rhodospirillales bacterium]|nr:site-2 protease family protein [Rhodospirillales bacterium]